MIFLCSMSEPLVWKTWKSGKVRELKMVQGKIKIFDEKLRKSEEKVGKDTDDMVLRKWNFQYLDKILHVV